MRFAQPWAEFGHSRSLKPLSRAVLIISAAVRQRCRWLPVVFGNVDFTQMHLWTSGLCPDPSLWAVNCSVSFPNEWSQPAAHPVTYQHRFVVALSCLCILGKVSHESQDARGWGAVLSLGVRCPMRVPALAPVLSSVLTFTESEKPASRKQEN